MFGYKEILNQIRNFPSSDKWNTRAVDAALTDGRITPNQKKALYDEIEKCRNQSKKGEIENDFSKFNSRDYLDEYYNKIGPENRSLLEFFNYVYNNVIPINNYSLLEFGGEAPPYIN